MKSFAAAAAFVALGISSPLNSAQAFVGNACSAALESLGPHVVDTRPLNQTVVNENWSNTCIENPYCVIQPQNREHVAEALRIVGRFRVKFAVRSGGHSPNPGAASIGEHGILFDMSKLDQVTISTDSAVVEVGPGSRWGNVAASLAPHGLSVIGARAPFVGVGGLLLGGGYSYFSSEYGLATDNIKSYEVVLSNGTIINASIGSHPDLFWALKGGGPNFGVITRYDLYTVPINKIWYRGDVYSPNQALDILDTFAAWQKGGAADLKSNIALSIGLDQVIVVLTYASPTADPATFAPFYKLKPLLEVIPPTNGTLHSLNQLVDSFIPLYPARHDYRAASSRIDSQLYKDVYAFWLEQAITTRRITGANQTFSLQHVSHNVARQGIQKGGNPLGLPLEDHQWWTTLVDWEKEGDDDIVRSASIATTRKWEELSITRGLHIPNLYMNDASRDQDPIGSYGKANVAKLNAIALKYDPKRILQNLQNGGFLLKNTSTRV